MMIRPAALAATLILAACAPHQTGEATSPVQPSAAAPTAAQAQTFSDAIRSIFMQLDPLCMLSQDRTNDAITAPSHALLDAFRQEITGTPYAALYDTAVRDAAIDRSHMVARCVVPATGNADAESKRMLTETRETLGTLRALIADGKR